MALINLTTNLKSLKFGNDQFDGGSSNQPYIQTPIPDELGEYGFLNQDFILRGGSKAVTDSLIDVKRLGKYFTDTKSVSGVLFIAKQNLLSRTAVRTQTSGFLNEGIYTPLSTLTQAGGNAFGLHVNKQGLNPFDGEGSIGKYSEKISNEIFEILNSPDGILKNRLYALYESKIQNGTLGGFAKENDISPLPTDILTYNGGPGSILGIGNTNIKFADQRTGLNNPELKNSGFFKTTYTVASDGEFGPQNSTVSSSTLNYSVFKRPLITINGNKLLGASYAWNSYFPNNNSPLTSGSNGFTVEGKIDSEKRNVGYLDNPDKTLSDYPSKNILSNLTYEQGVITYDQDFLSTRTVDDLYGYTSFESPEDFRKILRDEILPNLSPSQQNLSTQIGNLSKSPDYRTLNISRRVNLGDPGNRGSKNLDSYVSGSGDALGAASYQSYDKINVSPIYQSAGPQGTNNPDPNALNNDLVKFRIGIYDLHTDGLLKNYIHFRAFLNQISDTYIAEWNATKYIGRGENFYTYGGFDRKFSLSWTVAAQSKVELIPMYKKLNYLASICAPDYSANGYMRGNIITLTVGGYLYEQPGLITGLSYEMNEDNATWEIGIDTDGRSDNSVKELPHLIKVTGFNFIPIHDFVPRLQQNKYGTFDEEKPYMDSNNYGPERFIALSAGKESNYGTIYRRPK